MPVVCVHVTLNERKILIVRRGPLGLHARVHAVCIMPLKYAVNENDVIVKLKRKNTDRKKYFDF